MTEGQEGFAFGRKARLVKVFNHCIRVLYLEPDDRYQLLDKLFVPFEATVPANAWTIRR